MAPDQVAAGSGYRRAADRRRRGDPGEAGEGGGHGGHRDKVEALEKQAQELGDRIRRLNEDRTSLENHVQRADVARKTAEMRFIASGGRILGAPAGPGRAEEGAGDLLRGNRNTASEASGRRVAPGHVGDYEVCIFLSKADERVWMLKRNNHRNNGPAA